MQLTQHQIKHLKSSAHALKPIVRVGQHGVTDAVIKELGIALAHHELLKIKVGATDREERVRLINELCQKTQAECVQKIGSVAVLFRRNTKNPSVTLPG